MENFFILEIRRTNDLLFLKSKRILTLFSFVKKCK